MSGPIRSATSSALLAAVVVFLLGGVAGFVLRDLTRANANTAYSVQRGPGWEYINPLLDCERGRDTLENNEVLAIRAAVGDFIRKRLNRKWASTVNVYFRELNDGSWFDIGDLEKFKPASLLKVPLMIAVLKQAETDPSILHKRVSFTDKEILQLPNPATPPLEFGRTYDVEQLLHHMIVHSDNMATYLLGNTVDLDILSQTYGDLGLPNPYRRLGTPPVVVASSDYMISAYSYASFFRILFNASYLSNKMSDKALRLLTESDFRTGLVAGVPKQIRVAHKWGTHLSGVNQEIKQLHDCGIVYFPDHPYLLCVMTAGASMEYLDDTISEVSRVVYENMVKQNQSP
ncbi:MAG: serine hydrolase [Nitrospirae bacterium]|nr:serine hydrolase [Nitrospirota bacterium]